MNEVIKGLLEKNPILGIILIVVLSFGGGFGAASTKQSPEHVSVSSIEKITEDIADIKAQVGKNIAVINVQLENLGAITSELNERLKALERK